jgi:hypothetical protein
MLLTEATELPSVQGILLAAPQLFRAFVTGIPFPTSRLPCSDRSQSLATSGKERVLWRSLRWW